MRPISRDKLENGGKNHLITHTVTVAEIQIVREIQFVPILSTNNT